MSYCLVLKKAVEDEVLPTEKRKGGRGIGGLAWQTDLVYLRGCRRATPGYSTKETRTLGL